LGTALFGGLLVATLLSLLLVPVLYILIKGLAERFLGANSRPVPLAPDPLPPEPAIAAEPPAAADSPSPAISQPIEENQEITK
jgi:HAE1 family hydrophobic/amphiphilic exporter-1